MTFSVPELVLTLGLSPKLSRLPLTGDVGLAGEDGVLELVGHHSELVV